MTSKFNPVRTCRLASAAGLLALAAALPARADYPSTVSSYNPAAYWRLNETTPVPAVDPTTNSATGGTSTPGYYMLGVRHPVTGIPGAGTDGAATIPNVNNNGRMRVQVPFQPALNQAVPFTAEFWARPAQSPSTTGNGSCPYNSVDFANARGWLFYQGAVVANQWTFRVYKGGSSTTISGGTFASNEWAHVVGVYDGTSMSLYVNGQLSAGPTSLGGAFVPVNSSNSLPLMMGMRSDNSWAYTGDMDEVVLYTNVLSAADILAHYQAGTNSATADYSALVTMNNPVGYWRLDEPALSLPVAANSGSLAGGAQGSYMPSMTNGVAGPGFPGLGSATAAAFNGVDGYVKVGANVPVLSAPLSSMTIMTWGKFPAVRPMNWEAIITCGDTAWELQRPDNDYGVDFRFKGTDLKTPSTMPINDGNWHHIAATYDGAQQKVYIDGTLAASQSLTGTNSGETRYPILIGENGQWSGRVFQGSLAEMAVFTNALSAADIQTIYNAAQVPPAITSQPASLLRFVGSPATFSVVARGSLPFTYQWKRNGSSIPGATNASVTVPTVEWADNGATFSCTATDAQGLSTNTATATLTVRAEFAATTLPEAGSRDRHTALGSDGANLYFTRANGSAAGFYKMPEGFQPNWTSLASPPLPTTWNGDSGVGDLAYYGGALWTLARNNSGDGTSARAVYKYDIASDTWTLGSKFTTGDGPNTACAVINESNILGGWIGYYPVNNVTNWQASGGYVKVGDMAGGAVHPWDSCVGPNNVYFMKHYNGSGNGVLASINKTGTPTLTSINGMPFNPGIGCAMEYMPGSFFPDAHARLYILRGGASGSQNDGSDWNNAQSVDQLAVFDLVNSTWDLQTLPFAVDQGSEMCLVNQNLYVLAANGEAQPLKVLYFGPAVIPTVTSSPLSKTIYVGQSASFSVGVYGGGPVTYQWRRNGANIPGATGRTYAVANADFTDAGSIDVVVQNAAGTATSQAASLMVLPLPTFANLTNGLVLHLKFDGDFTDASPSADNAVQFGTPAFVPGKLGQAVHLDGTNFLQVYEVGTELDFDATTSFTVAFWLKYTTAFNDLPIIGNATGSTWQKGWVFSEDAGQLDWTFTDAANASIRTIADPVGPPQINDGLWHQVTVAFDRSAGAARTYVDGALIDTRSIAAVGSVVPGNPLTLGQDPTGIYVPAQKGSFDLDDVGIWNRALSPTEAQAVYMVGQNHGQSFDTVAPMTLFVRKNGAALQFIWQAGTLQWADDLNGNWTNVPGATAPYYQPTPDAAKKFFRVKF